MTKEEAWLIIEACKNWNVGQCSISIDPTKRASEDKVFDARRAALATAWETVGSTK